MFDESRADLTPFYDPFSKDLTWNHDANREGVLQLVIRKQHKSPGNVQQSLHPDGRGGMANWGGGR